MVNCKTEITQKELDALLQISMKDETVVKKIKTFRIVLLSIAALVFLFTFLAWSQSSLGNNLLGLALAVIIALFAIFVAPSVFKTAMKRAQDKADIRAKTGTREYTFSENGVVILSEYAHSELSWNAFKCWGIYENYIFLMKADNGCLIVNKNNLSSDEVNELLALLNANTRQR